MNIEERKLELLKRSQPKTFFLRVMAIRFPMLRLGEPEVDEIPTTRTDVETARKNGSESSTNTACYLEAFPELSQKDRDNYKRLMNMGPGEVCYSFKVHLQHSDIQTLKPGTWLNDEVINF